MLVLYNKAAARRTPLPWAAENLHAVVVRLLLKTYGDVESKRSEDCTPLYLATLVDKYAVVMLLRRKSP